MHRDTRLTTAVALAVFLFAGAAPSHAFTFPFAPTFGLVWGKLGTAPGTFTNPQGVATDRDGNVYVVDSGNNRIQKFDRLGNFILSWDGPFFGPVGIATDLAGNVYVADFGNDRILKFNSVGVSQASWGSTGTGDGEFSGPVGLAVDAAGNVYVADQFNNRIQKFNSFGVFVSKWGFAGSGNGQFNTPVFVAVDPAGDVFVVDNGNARVQKFTNTGTYLTQWGTFGGGAGEFASPMGLASDAVGSIYVADGNNRIQKFTGSGTFVLQWGAIGSGNGQMAQPVGVAVDAEANVYVAEVGNQRIQKFTSAGAPLSEPVPSFLLKWGSLGAGNGQFDLPFGITVDLSGSVYVTDINNHRIQKFTSTGGYITKWGSFGTGNSQFSGPNGVCADAAGNIYVMDTGNHRIQKFNGSGAYLKQWGSFGTGNGQFNAPTSMAVNAAGDVYVADFGNHRIQKFTSGGDYILQFGTPGSGDGQLSSPYGVAIDPAGNVFVVESGTHRVSKFSGTGQFLKNWGGLGSTPGLFLGPRGCTVDPYGNLYVVDYGNNRIQKFTGDGRFLSRWGFSSSSNGNFGQPVGGACDAAGNLYIVDTDNQRVQKFVVPPTVAYTSDVRNDQGRSVQLRVLRSSADSPGSVSTITGYEVYRRNDAVPLASELPAASRPGAAPSSAQLANWTYVASMPAHGESEYSLVVSTLVDATASVLEYSAYFVRAVTADPLTFFDSAVDNGFSVDNLPPPPPAPFLAAYASGATHLNWGESPVADFASFRLYRGASADFIPALTNRLVETVDFSHVDPGAAGSWYKLSAVDRNGNESVFAVRGPAQTTDVELPGALEAGLRGVWPNPGRGDRAIVSFALASGEPATLELVDVAGRRVLERAVGSLGVGRHELDLAGGRRLAAGVYMVRLTQGPRAWTTRVAIVN